MTMTDKALAERKVTALGKLMADRSLLNSQVRYWKKQSEMLSRTREEQRRRAERAEASAEELADALQRIADSFHGIKPPEGPCVHMPYVWAIEALDAYRSKQ
jgi:hypothetical protein